MDGTEGLRQTLVAVFFALAHAGGGDTLRKAMGVLTDAIDSNAIDDPFAVGIVQDMARAAAEGERAANKEHDH